MPSSKVKPANISGDAFELASGLDSNHPPLRLLVIEDDSLILKLYSDVLMRSGYHVDTAEDGAAGWEALDAAHSAFRNYDLLLTDNSMPKMTGVELIARLRSKNMDLPVILATGMAPANIEHLRLSAILEKPFSMAELLGKVEEVLEGTARCRA